MIFTTRMQLRTQGECEDISTTFVLSLYLTSSLLFDVIFRAYKDAMDVQKHGGKIFLPQHLHANLEEKYRQLLTSS